MSGYPTNTALSANSTTLVAGATATLMANVTQANSAVSVVPTGSVTFYDADSPLGTAPLANGTATLAVALTTVGTHPITAKYTGDSADAASASSALTVNVLAPFLVAPASGSSNSLTASYNGSATTSIALAPQNGFTGSVGLTCANLPAGVTCTFSPSNVTLTSTAPVPVLLTVAASSTVGALQMPSSKDLEGIALAGLLFTGLLAFPRRLPQGAARLLVLLGLCAGGLMITGCSGGSGSSGTTTTTTNPSKNVTFAVVASSGGAQVSTPYTLTVR